MTFFYDLNKRLADLDRPQTQTLTESSKIKKGEVDEGPEVFKLKADAARKAGAKEFEGPDGKTYPVKEGNDGNLANNAKPYDKVTRGDVIAGRLGKDEMGGKAKKIKEQGVAEDQVKEAQTYGPDNPYQVKPGEDFGKVFEPGRRSGVHYHLNTGMVTDPFYFKLNNKLYSVSNKGDGLPREVGTNDQDLGQDVSMPSLIDYPGTDDPNLKLAKDYAKLMGFNPEDMDEIKPLLAVMKSNPTYKRLVQDKVKNQDNSKKPFGNQGVAEDRLDELSPDTLKSYLQKSKGRAGEFQKQGDSTDNEKKADKFYDKRDSVLTARKGARDRLKGVFHPKQAPYGMKDVAEEWDDTPTRRKSSTGGEIDTTEPGVTRHRAGRSYSGAGHDVGADDDKDKATDKKRGPGAPKKNKAPERVTAKAYKHKHGRVEEGMDDQMPAGNYETGERGEYDREGDMAKEQLHTIEQAAQELKSILSDEENLPEWVQSKITKAMDYVDTARDYMLAQHDDRVNERELSKSERKEKERVFKKDMKPQMADFKKRYGKEQGENVAHAVATNIAKGVKMGKKKKEESVDETTTAGSVAVSDAAPKGKKSMSFGKGIYDSVNREVEKLITESMSINASMNMDQHGGPSRTLTVNATDDDAEKLAALLMMAGIGPQDGGCPSCGAASCDCDQQMDEAYGDTNATENQPDYPTAQEGSNNAFQYSGGLNKPKVTGQTTVPVTGVQPAQSPLMYENSDLVRMLEMAGMDAAQLEPYRHTMKETDAEKSSVVKKEPGGFSATAPAGKRLSVTLGKQPLKPSDVKVKDMDENLVVTPAPSTGSTVKPAAPSAGSTVKPAPAPTKPGPIMGTIKDGVWTATPPKPGEKGVPMPTPLDEVEPPEFSMGAGRPMPRTRTYEPEPEMSMGATGKVNRSAVPMTVPPGVAGTAFDAGQMASLSRIIRGAQETPNYVGTQPEGQMGATGNPQRPMKPLTKPLDLHTDPKVMALPNAGPQQGLPRRTSSTPVRENSMENNLMRELANFKSKK